jgi:hypothetical protein
MSDAHKRRWATTTPDECKARTAPARAAHQQARQRKAHINDEMIALAERALVASGAQVTWPDN